MLKHNPFSQDSLKQSELEKFVVKETLQNNPFYYSQMCSNPLFFCKSVLDDLLKSKLVIKYKLNIVFNQHKYIYFI